MEMRRMNNLSISSSTFASIVQGISRSPEYLLRRIVPGLLVYHGPVKPTAVTDSLTVQRPLCQKRLNTMQKHSRVLQAALSEPIHLFTNVPFDLPIVVPLLAVSSFPIFSHLCVCNETRSFRNHRQYL